MPKAIHDALSRVAKSKGYGKERANAFIYGTMTNMKKKKRRKATEKERKMAARKMIMK